MARGTGLPGRGNPAGALALLLALAFLHVASQCQPITFSAADLMKIMSSQPKQNTTKFVVTEPKTALKNMAALKKTQAASDAARLKGGYGAAEPPACLP